MRGLAWHKKLALILAAWAVLVVFVPAIAGLPRAITTLHVYLSGLRTRRYTGDGWGTLTANAEGYALWSLGWVGSLEIPPSASAVALRFLPATCPAGRAEAVTVTSGSDELAHWTLGPHPVWHTVAIPATAPMEDAGHIYTPLEVAFSCTLAPAPGVSPLSLQHTVGGALTGIRVVSPAP